MLSRSTLSRSILSRSILPRSIPSRSILSRSILSRSVLSRSILSRSVLSRSILPRSILSRFVLHQQHHWPAVTVPDRPLPSAAATRWGGDVRRGGGGVTDNAGSTRQRSQRHGATHDDDDDTADCDAAADCVITLMVCYSLLCYNGHTSDFRVQNEFRSLLNLALSRYMSLLACLKTWPQRHSGSWLDM